MEIASAVIAHNFDQAMLEQIDTLRVVRLNLAETMLKDLTRTASELETRGLAESVDQDELRAELTQRIATMRERLQRKDVIYADEVSLYVDLMDCDLEGAEEDEDA